jgi:hypothetical protein
MRQQAAHLEQARAAKPFRGDDGGIRRDAAEGGRGSPTTHTENIRTKKESKSAKIKKT